MILHSYHDYRPSIPTPDKSNRRWCPKKDEKKCRLHRNWTSNYRNGICCNKLLDSEINIENNDIKLVVISMTSFLI